jgi:hypothetical protein
MLQMSPGQSMAFMLRRRVVGLVAIAIVSNYGKVRCGQTTVWAFVGNSIVQRTPSGSKTRCTLLPIS